MGVAVVDVGEMFVLVTDREVTVPCPREHLDRLWSVVRIARIDRMRVLQGFMAMEVTVVAGRDQDHTDEGHGERHHRCRCESVTVDRPCEQRSDERGERR